MDQFNMNPMAQPAYIPETPKKRRGFGHTLLTILFLLILVGTNVYWWQLYSNAQKMNDVLGEQNMKLQSIASNVEKLTTSIEHLQAGATSENTSNTGNNTNTSNNQNTSTKPQAFFDKCGSVALFESEEWFENWQTAVTKTPRSNAMDPVAVAGMVNMESITDMCFSSRMQIVLALVKGDEKGQGFKLLRFDIAGGTLAIATREDFEGSEESLWYQWHVKRNNTPIEKNGVKYFPWFYPPTQFGSRENNLLLLTATTKDATCSGNFEYAYDIEKNYLFMRNLCQTCEGQPPSCSDLSQQ